MLKNKNVCIIIVSFIFLIITSLFLYSQDYDTNYYKNIFYEMFTNKDKLKEMAKDPQGYIDNLLEKALKEKIELYEKYNVIEIDSLEDEYQNTAEGYGDLEDVKKFVEKYDINGVYDGYTLLYTYSGYRGSTDIVEFLLENNADVYQKSINGKTALYSAVDDYFYDVVEIILKHYKNDDDINDEFLLAVNKENELILKSLLKKKFLFFGNKFKMNLDKGLEIALDKGNEDIAAILVLNGAKTDNFLYSFKLVFGKYLILIVIMIALFSSLIYVYKRRYIPTIYEESSMFITFKDKVNNMYIYCYVYYGKLFDGLLSVKKGFRGNIFINNDNLKGYYNIVSNFLDNYIAIYDFDDNKQNDKEYINWYDILEERNEKASIKFDCSLYDFINGDKNEINYIMEVSDSKIMNGVFEVNRNPDIKVKYFKLIFKKIAKYKHFINILRYLFDLYHFNIKNNDKINSYINADNKPYNEKKNELKINVEQILKKHDKVLFNDIKIKYYDKLKDFYNADNIVYFDEKTICVYKRFAKIGSDNNLLVNNISLIIDLDNEKLISPYLKDFVNNADDILKRYNVPKNFYNDTDNLIFLITEAGIILMRESGEQKLFISLDDIKYNINKEHYLSYLFN
ncbi:ankyrin repeat domain-containing protein [Brachyspira sp. SAP_772]|uniref:ankyrin repeat domain-containing protein n=1 Tax=Brachyspira sp. SAP_772 TaxID=2608385 RepID=UPI0012F4B558|nr:ankyrin repeat domain-containing protein [Brachyspira sp. SAP_772]